MNNFNKLTWHMGLILACWNDPIRMQAMLNMIHTKWNGDAYAMVQRQEELSKVA